MHCQLKRPEKSLQLLSTTVQLQSISETSSMASPAAESRDYTLTLQWKALVLT